MSYNLYQRGRGWPSIFFLATLVGFLIDTDIIFLDIRPHKGYNFGANLGDKGVGYGSTHSKKNFDY